MDFTQKFMIALTFGGRLFYIQVLKEDYKLSALNNVVRVEKVYPGRGLIYDRNQKLLVGNQSAYDLMVIPAQVKSIDTIAFCELLEIDKETFQKQLSKAKRYSYLKPSIFMKCADWIIDLGPEGGNTGGDLVFQGNPEDLVQNSISHTAKYLKDKL